MAHINRNFPNFIDIRISQKDYYDFQLANFSKVCSCDNFTNPFTCILFTGGTFVYGDTIWGDAIATPQTIKNFGITGYDNRYVDSIDSDLEVDGELNLILKEVDGELFCYGLTGSTFCGGFYQGHYKIEGYDYETLPEFYEDGWTMEFSLTKSGCTDCNGTLLNDEYPNNEGIFFYWGTRAENKFCSINEDTLAYEVQSGVTFLESVIQDTSHITPNENPFLFFTCKKISDYIKTTTGTTIELPDCCDGLKYNALAFRITDDNKIGYRYLGASGECFDGQFVEELAIFEKYSSYSVITEGKNHIVTIIYKNNKHLECKSSKLTFGTLSIYVDGYLKLREYDFPNIIPYEFNDLPSKQLGVPFNISIGGGTQGLLEANQNEPVTYSVCNYKFYIKEGQTFKGIKINDAEILSDNLIFTDYTEIITFLEENITGIFGSITPTITSKYVQFDLSLVYDDFQEIFTEFQIEDNFNDCCIFGLPDYSPSTPIKSKCFTFTTSNDSCGILEENFAGTFIGQINSYCLYNTPFNLEQVRCNIQTIYS